RRVGARRYGPHRRQRRPARPRLIDDAKGRSVAVEVGAELLAAVRVAQLGQRLGLDLADALAGDAELAPDLLERPGLTVLEAEAQPDDLLLALVELAHGVDHRVDQHRAG